MRVVGGASEEVLEGGVAGGVEDAVFVFGLEVGVEDIPVSSRAGICASGGIDHGAHDGVGVVGDVFPGFDGEAATRGAGHLEPFYRRRVWF